MLFYLCFGVEVTREEQNNKDNNGNDNITVIIIIECLKTIKNALEVLPQNSRPPYKVETLIVSILQMREPSGEANGMSKPLSWW